MTRVGRSSIANDMCYEEVATTCMKHSAEYM